MLRSLVVTALVAVLLPSLVAAEGSKYPVTLKKDLFSGYRWSADDGYSYQKVGHDGDSLRAYMAGDEKAVEKMDDYRRRRYSGRVAGIACAVGLGAICYQGMSDNNEDVGLVLGTLGVGIVAMTFNWMANNSLEDAVALFNRESGWPQLSLGVGSGSPSGDPSAAVGLTISL